MERPDSPLFPIRAFLVAEPGRHDHGLDPRGAACPRPWRGSFGAAAGRLAGSVVPGASVATAALLGLLLAALLSPGPAVGLDGPAAFTILHVSDFHGHLEPFDCASGSALGGVARLQCYKAALEAKGRRVLVLSSGDAIQGTLSYRLFRRFPEVELMNRLGVAAMALGNHEFDGGIDLLAAGFADCAFPLLSANLRVSAEHPLARLVRPWALLEVPTTGGTARLAVIGLTDEMLIDSAPAYLLRGVAVGDAFTVMRRLLPEVKRARPDLIVVLSHLGWPREVGLAEAFPEVAGVLGGHTHLFVDPPLVRETAYGHQFLSQPGEYGRALTRYDLRLIPVPAPVATAVWAPARVEVQAAALVPIDATVPEDPGIHAWLAAFRAEFASATGEVIGRASDLLDGDRPRIRRRDTNLGNLIADAMLEAWPADVAFMNGGGIRGSIATGEISVGDCLAVLPFENRLVRLAMRGHDLYRLFAQVEEGVRFFPDYGGFLHVSKGFQVRLGGPDGPQLHLRGKPIDRQQVYTVTTVDFLAGGGNGLEALTRHLASETSNLLVADALIAAIRRRQTVGGPVEERTQVRFDPGRRSATAPGSDRPLGKAQPPAPEKAMAVVSVGWRWVDLLSPASWWRGLAAGLARRSVVAPTVVGGIEIPFPVLIPSPPWD